MAREPILEPPVDPRRAIETADAPPTPQLPSAPIVAREPIPEPPVDPRRAIETATGPWTRTGDMLYFHRPRGHRLRIDAQTCACGRTSCRHLEAVAFEQRLDALRSRHQATT